MATQALSALLKEVRACTLWLPSNIRLIGCGRLCVAATGCLGKGG